jgi:hypothetical protein
MDSEPTPEHLRGLLAKSLSRLERLTDMNAADVVVEQERRIARGLIGKLEGSDAKAVMRAWPRGARLLARGSSEVRRSSEIKRYPSAGVVPPAPGAPTVVDVRCHIPLRPPEGWSVPVVDRDDDQSCSVQIHGVTTCVELAVESGLLCVVIGPKEGKRASDEVVTGILRHLRMCEPFVEMSLDGENGGDPPDADLSSVRGFLARTHPASPETRAEVREPSP